MHARDELIAFADALIDEGASVLATKFERQTSSFTVTAFVELQPFQKWKSSTFHLIEMLGPFGTAWKHILDPDFVKLNYHSVALSIQGVIQSIRENLETGRLAKVEELVAAETFANVLEQAEHLLESKYYLAAGVLCRAILEERLRMLSQREKCLPVKDRPTINDYAQALYSKDVISKIALKSVEAMAVTGNEAAHNVATLTAGDVQQMYSNLITFLQRHEP